VNDQTSQSGGFGRTLTERHRERLSGIARKDFRFGSINAFLLVTIFIVGLVAHIFVYSASSQAVWTALGTAMALVVLLWLIQVWEGVVVMCVATCLTIYLELRPESGVFIATTIVALLLAPTIQMALQWERAVVLRVGKFRGLRGPGIFVMLPLVDKVAQYVDQRVRVTDFNAETTLTADTVPVSVDAIGFWMVWDPERAVLEVEGFEEAVVLSAQTALRNAIGKNDLAVLLSERDRLGQEIQKVLDEKTNTWGITTTAVEIRDIIIPEALEDAMSRQAQAERERQSRVILGTAETEIAEKYAHASRHYQGNQVALHLRAMNMVYEGLRHRGAMVIVPSSAVETMGLGALGGLTAFGKMNEDQPDLDGGESPPPPPPVLEP
jgi:regulator of protease activity HflC (stomatin/prohibitin superfamily)